MAIYHAYVSIYNVPPSQSNMYQKCIQNDSNEIKKIFDKIQEDCSSLKLVLNRSKSIIEILLDSNVLLFHYAWRIEQS